MRKASLISLSFIFAISLIPINPVMAANSIEEGTEVYGEDISELSEDELKYIPKAWRDGNVEGEHQHITEEEAEKEKKQAQPRSRITTFSAHPDVNDYVQDVDPVETKYEHKSKLPKFNYRNGKGAVEGIVAHETDNNYSSIRDEINYMESNYNNAFVHAYVNHNQVIETHPTDYAAWGAGRYANERFVHVELVREDTFKEFAQSINHYSDYIASLMYEYNLGVTSAEKDGKGTLWSHKAVSNHLGGTTHVDPHSYFAKWGYNWQDFVKLIENKYEKEVQEHDKNTSKLGHLQKGAEIYEDPIAQKSKRAGAKYLDQVYYIKAEAKLNGKQFYLISNKPSAQKGIVGWVEASDITTQPHQGVDKKDKKLEIAGNGDAYDKAWGGSKDHVYNLENYTGDILNVDLTESVGDETWYRGTLNGEQVWMNEDNLAIKEKTSKLGHLKSDAVILDELSNPSSAYSADNYLNAVYYIKEQADVRGKTYYHISNRPSSTNGTIGWVKASDMSTHPHQGVDKKDKTFVINGSGSATSKAWGGSKDEVYDLSNYQGDQFNVDLTEEVGGNIWYRGELGGKSGVWVHSSNVTDIEKESTSKLGHLRSDAEILDELGNPSSAYSADDYLNAVYYIKEQAQVGDDTYYHISNRPSSTTGTIGWVKASDMSTHPHKGVDKKDKTFVINGSGPALAKAWGGSKDEVYNLSNYQGDQFNVHMTEEVGGNIWYRGELGGKSGVWVHSSNVADIEKESTSKLGHLRADAEILDELGNPSSAYSAADYLNAVYYIKEQAQVGDDTYYHISNRPSSTTGTIGWVKASDMSTHPHQGVDKKDKTFVINGSGSATTKAWGGSKDEVYDLSNYQGEIFNVHMTEEVGGNIWYRGDLDGKTVWMHHSNVTKN